MKPTQNDQAQRSQALDPSVSFIVQAPAGSGKTELLTQRFLTLLACSCQAPEEIIALTFTRKAAHEMRARIVQALERAQQPAAPSLSAHQLQTHQLGKRVLEKNTLHQWQLIDNPGRLKIMTIDSLAYQLSHQIPMLSQLGAHANPSDHPQQLYQQAVDALFKTSTHSPKLNPHLSALLLHLNGNVPYLSELLIQMLNNRCQWLPHLLPIWKNPEQWRQKLEHIRQDLAKIQLNHLLQQLPICEQQWLNELAIHAATQLGDTLSFKDSPLDVTLQLDKWQYISKMVLTKTLQWRRTVTKKQGFLSVKTQPHISLKQQLQQWLSEQQEHHALRLAFAQIQQCPPLIYSDEQWNTLQHLAHVLPELVAFLLMQFEQSKQCDFNQINLCALQALGTEEQPTDLALHLDYGIKHLLVDEFQDTSVVHHQLISQLVQGWQDQDGRTLFVVGDPMQSIYRFRNAEVSLFMHLQTQGIAQIKLTALHLHKNFRSTKALVDWTNDHFCKIFPDEPDFSLGGVPYNFALAHNKDDQTAVFYHAFEQAADQTQGLCQSIKKIQQQDPHSSIACIVRARSHIKALMPVLQAQDIPFAAHDIEPIAQKKSIQIVVTLTRALYHLNDRIAWLALLRSPLVGLTLQELLTLSQIEQPLIIDALKQMYKQKLATPASQVRLEKIITILQHAIAQSYQTCWRDVVSPCWEALGGLCTLEHASHIEAIETVFEWLEALDQSMDLEQWQQKVDRHYVSASTQAKQAVHIMTIHKSKGLEYDHVFLLHLEKRNPPPHSALLLWQETRINQQQALLVAPIKKSHSEHESLYRYLQNFKKSQEHHEMARLLYVACTRAKKTLNLYACIAQPTQDKAYQPNANSFLGLLWPSCQREFLRNFKISDEKKPSDEVQTHTDLSPPLTRTDLSVLTEPLKIKAESSRKKNYVTFSSLIDPKKITGTLTHHWIYQLSQLMNRPKTTEQLTLWLQANQQTIEQQSQQHGLNKAQAAAMLFKIRHSLNIFIQSSRGQWLLSDAHKENHHEWPLLMQTKKGMEHCILDRFFIETDQGKEQKQWAIDYKIVMPQNNTLCLATLKKNHQEQLLRYAQALEQLQQSTAPVYCGIYAVNQDAWISWPYR